MGPLGPIPKMSSGNSTPSIGTQVGSMAGDFVPKTSSSGSGFGGAFSKNFGESFLDMWKNRNAGGGGSDNSKNYFGPSELGGGSMSPIGSGGKHFLYQYTHPQATIMPTAPSQPGFGAQLAQTAASAGVSALIGGLCDIRTKVDMAPLESTEVNDSLAEIAFFVKGLRECA